MGSPAATLRKMTIAEGDDATRRPDRGSARRYLVGAPGSDSGQRDPQDSPGRGDHSQRAQSGPANCRRRSAFNRARAKAADCRSHAISGAEFRGRLRPVEGCRQAAPHPYFGSAFDCGSTPNRSGYPAHSGTLMRRPAVTLSPCDALQVRGNLSKGSPISERARPARRVGGRRGGSGRARSIRRGRGNCPRRNPRCPFAG